MSRSTNGPGVLTTPSDREIRVECTFDVPVERLWRACTDPAELARWYGRRGEVVVERMDLEAGGRFRFVHRSPDGDQVSQGSFREVVPERRLVRTYESDERPGQVSTTTIEFEDLGGGRSRIVSTALFDTVEERDAMLAGGMEQGLQRACAALGRVLAEDT